MEKLCNLYKTEQFFREYLISKNAEKNKPIKSNTLRGYLSDLRLFFFWLFKDLKINSEVGKIHIPALVKKINQLKLKQFIEYLHRSKTPESSIKRKLSSLRSFFSFCISQGWIKENPAKRISFDPVETEKEILLGNFFSELISVFKKDEETARKIKTDVSELLAVINSNC